MENRISLLPDVLVLIAVGLILCGSVSPWATLDPLGPGATHAVGGPSNVITGFSDQGGRPALLFIGVTGFMLVQLIVMIGAFPRGSIVTLVCGALILACGLCVIYMSVAFMTMFRDISLAPIAGHNVPIHVGAGLKLMMTGGAMAMVAGPLEMLMRRKKVDKPLAPGEEPPPPAEETPA